VVGGVPADALVIAYWRRIPVDALVVADVPALAGVAYWIMNLLLLVSRWMPTTLMLLTFLMLLAFQLLLAFFLLLVFLDSLRFGLSCRSFVISVPGVC
jgi:hypothetical protein